MKKRQQKAFHIYSHCFQSSFIFTPYYLTLVNFHTSKLSQQVETSWRPPQCLNPNVATALFFR